MKKLLKYIPVLAVMISSFFIVDTLSAQSPGDTIKTPRPDDRMTVNPGKTNDANAMLTDTGFISKNIMDNMAEIQFAKTGREKGNAQVKKLASLLIADHTAMLGDLRKFVSARPGASVESHMGAMPSMPPTPEIVAGEGSDFNAAWATQMLTMHEQKIKELEDFISVTQNAEIKAMAMKALPKIKTHRDMLTKIPGAKPGGGSTIMQ